MYLLGKRMGYIWKTKLFFVCHRLEEEKTVLIKFELEKSLSSADAWLSDSVGKRKYSMKRRY